MIGMDVGARTLEASSLPGWSARRGPRCSSGSWGRRVHQWPRQVVRVDSAAVEATGDGGRIDMAERVGRRVVRMRDPEASTASPLGVLPHGRVACRSVMTLQNVTSFGVIPGGVTPGAGGLSCACPVCAVHDNPASGNAGWNSNPTKPDRSRLQATVEKSSSQSSVDYGLVVSSRAGMGICVNPRPDVCHPEGREGSSHAPARPDYTSGSGGRIPRVSGGRATSRTSAAGPASGRESPWVHG